MSILIGLAAVGALASPAGATTAPTGDSIFSSPAVANGVVYVDSFDDKLYAFPASCSNNCSPLWTGTTGAVANGVVFVGSFDDNLYAWDLAAGPTTPARPDPAMLKRRQGLLAQR